MNADAKVDAVEGPKVRFEVINAVRHKGKDYAPGNAIALTDDEANHLVRDGMVKVAGEA